MIQKLRAFRNANDRIAELVVRVEGIWTKTETQIIALKKVGHGGNGRLQDFHEECE